MSFILLKYLHVVFVATSFSLFFIRGIWLLRAYPEAQESWVKILPHIVDTVLLLSGIGLYMMLPAQVHAGNWLTVKLSLIGVYIGLGLLLMRVLKARLPKLLVWLGNILLFLFIASIAVLHHPLGIAQLL